jgi:transcriptional regulator with XRE-family HTH domain
MPSGIPTLQIHDGKFGERLFQARRRQGYSREELQELTGVPARSIWRWETQPDVQPHLGKALRKLAEILGVSLDWLFTGEESNNGREPHE